MLLLLPFRAEIRTRRPPTVNYILIALNIGIFALTDVFGGAIGQEVKSLYMLDAAWPAPYQYLTYQFLHGDMMHLLGNMLFLWIFGNAVCDRMGGVAYLLFYLAGGVFAGVVFAASADNPMLGASGAIAAVTTAFLVLFPRVQIMLLAWIVYFISTIQIPAMIIIVFKIILWDNVIAPSIHQGVVSNVAYTAHLGGYAFGFAITTLLLMLRALPRNPFDLPGLWSRWRRRTGLTPAGPYVRPSIPTARPIAAQEVGSTPLSELPLTPLERLREDVLDALEAHDGARAIRLYGELRRLDPQAILPRRQQLELANELNQTGRHSEAVAAYADLLGAYPALPEAAQVRLLAGLICNRYLDRPADAVPYLRAAADGLAVQTQRDLALAELRDAEARVLGRRASPPGDSTPPETPAAGN